MTSVIDQIYNVSKNLRLNPLIALADAQVESGLNPTAVGDQGTSFGIYQLHEGGELNNLYNPPYNAGSLSQAEQMAENPTTNASVALPNFVGAAGSSSDPGVISAAAQRPADTSVYAKTVDSAYQNWLSVNPSYANAPTVGGNYAVPVAPMNINQRISNTATSTFAPNPDNPAPSTSAWYSGIISNPFKVYNPLKVYDSIFGGSLDVFGGFEKYLLVETAQLLIRSAEVILGVALLGYAGYVFYKILSDQNVQVLSPFKDFSKKAISAAVSAAAPETAAIGAVAK